MRVGRLKWFGIAVLIFFSCAGKEDQKKPVLFEEVSLSSTARLSNYPEHLSEWDLFSGNMSDLNPIDRALPYTLNTALFSDYAHKSRFIVLPEGASMGFHPVEAFDFPQGSIIVKSFYYPSDFRKPNGDKTIMETRLLVREQEKWSTLTYVWNDDQREADLQISGSKIPVSWIDNDGRKQVLTYSVPNLVQCKSCHEKSGKIVPIGPKAANLYNENHRISLLKRWEESGHLTGPIEFDEIDPLPVWSSTQSSIADRARAWLDINCAHCHQKEGPAKNTGLYLTYREKERYRLGILKPPVAAGRGSAGLQYAIVPGDPENSILYQRVVSLDPGIMMPEVGRKMNHKEGVEVLREWISQLE